ncbi:MAG: DUF4976 domain-containing protein [Nitrospirae bacterium]|nr:DUF4976 domain-containing protein [Nitrospirota bacterium]
MVQQVDIPPTILELADIPVASWMEGRSLIPLMRGKELPSRYSLSMHIEGIMRNRHKIMEGTFAVWEGDYKLIYYLKDNKSLLFNLRNDPDEINNIFEKDAETGGRLLSFIKSDFRKANERIGKGE